MIRRRGNVAGSPHDVETPSSDVRDAHVAPPRPPPPRPPLPVPPAPVRSAANRRPTLVDLTKNDPPSTVALVSTANSTPCRGERSEDLSVNYSAGSSTFSDRWESIDSRPEPCTSDRVR